MGWLRAIRRVNPRASLIRIAWWRLLQFLSWLVLFLLYRHRAWGMRNIPPTGPVLLVCNHQSYLDLTVLGCAIQHRHFHSMARRTLFRHPAFGWLIRSLNAFEVDQDRGDLRAIRTAIGKLKEEHLLLVFPEGSRTSDGRLQPFQSGVMTLLRRAKPTIVPMAVEGVYDVWPIWRKRPRLRGRVAAQYGRPIAAEALLEMEPEQAIEHLRGRVEHLRLDLRGKLRHQTHGRFPPSGPADRPDPALERETASLQGV
jgi:1-acyl-sn-glycerol-3-phosphate acyltransferase